MRNGWLVEDGGINLKEIRRASDNAQLIIREGKGGSPSITVMFVG